MAKETTITEKCKCQATNNATGGAIYGLGFIGALIYFLINATSFWNGVLGVLKAIVWPALLIYYALGFLKI